MSESPFRNRETRVKINPETYIKFDGTDHVHIQNLLSDNGVRIKPDIMLLMWDMVDWKTVGELIDPWPPDDQEKIMSHLEMLHEAKIIVRDESEIAVKPESGLSEHLGNKIHINVENHHAMLRDYVRVAAYRRAIERVVKPGMVAMDLGCGSGILSFFAAQAGADKVYAIERRQDIIMLAEEVAQRNGYAQIQFVEGASSQLKESLFNPKPDVLVAEILGNGILEENILEFTLDARDRFLKAGGKMIPWKLEIYVFAYRSEIKQDRWNEVLEFKDLYGVDFSVFGEVLCNKATLRLDRYAPMLNKTMSEPLMVKSLDFHTLKDTVFYQDFELPAIEDGEMTGFCAYFKAYLDEDTTLTNSPWAPQTHWTQLIYSLPKPRPVKQGEAVKMDIIYDGNLRIRML